MKGFQYLHFEAGSCPFFVPVAEIGQICEASSAIRAENDARIDFCTLLGEPETARYRIPIQTEVTFYIDATRVYGVETVPDENQWAMPIQTQNPANAFLTGIGKSEKGVVAFLLDNEALLHMTGKESQPREHVPYPSRNDAQGPFMALLADNEVCVVPERHILTVLIHADIMHIPCALRGIPGIIWYENRPIPVFSPESRPRKMLVLTEEEGITVALGADKILERVTEKTQPENSFCMDIRRLGCPDGTTYGLAAH